MIINTFNGQDQLCNTKEETKSRKLGLISNREVIHQKKKKVIEK